MAALLLVAGCVKPATDKPTTPGEPAGPATGELAETVAAMGDGATLVLALRGGDWRASPPGALPSMPFKRVLVAQSRAEALVSLASSAGLDVRAGAFAALSQDRPVLVALGEVPGRTLGVGESHSITGPLFGPSRTMLHLPTPAAEQLVADLSKELGDESLLPETATDLPGWRAWMVRPEDGSAQATIVALGPWRGGVGAMVLSGAQDIDPVRDAEEIAGLLALPEPAALSSTPALNLMLDAEVPLSGVFRAWNAPTYFQWSGQREGRMAADYANPRRHEQAAYRGMSIAAIALAYPNSAEAEAGAWGFTLHTDGQGIGLVAVGDLRTPGRTLLEGARLETDKSWTLLAAKPVRMQTNVDFEALSLKGAQAPLAEIDGNTRDRLRRNCGLGCVLYEWTRFPISAPSRRLVKADALSADVKDGRLVLAMQAQRDALVLNAAYGFGEYLPKSPPIPPTRGGRAGDSDGASAADEACVAGLAKQMALSDELVRLDRAELEPAMVKATREVIGAATCEAASPEARATAGRLAGWWLDAAVGWGVRAGEMGRARAVAAAACEADAKYCEAKTRLDQIPEPTGVVRLDAPSSCRPILYGQQRDGLAAPIVVTPDAISYGDTLLDKDPRAIATAIASYREPTDIISFQYAYDVGLLADGDMTVADLRPVLQGLAGNGLPITLLHYFEQGANLGDRDGSEAGVRALPVDLELDAGLAEQPPLVFALDGTRLTVRGPRLESGEMLRLESSVDQLSTLLTKLDALRFEFSGPGTSPDWDDQVLRLEVSGKTPWKHVLAMVVPLCGNPLILAPL